MNTKKIKCGKCKLVSDAEEMIPLAHYRCTKCKTVNNITNVELTEWIGFNYKQYLQEIIKFVTKDKYSNLRGQTAEDLNRGMLSAKQITTLKTVLKDNFKKGTNIQKISNDIKDKVKVQDLEVKNSNDTTYVISKEARAINIARTETTRAANAGAEAHYESKGVQEYEWVAAMTDRTCETCSGLSGKIFALGGDKPPAHALCRCTIIPVIPK